MVASPASRRAMLCGIASLPSLGGTASNVALVSPELRRLIAHHAKVDDDLQGDDNCTREHVLGAAAARAAIMAFPSERLADTMAKAECIVRTWGRDDLAEEVRENAASGAVYLDDMMQAVLLELVSFSEASA